MKLARPESIRELRDVDQAVVVHADVNEHTERLARLEQELTDQVETWRPQWSKPARPCAGCSARWR